MNSLSCLLVTAAALLQPPPPPKPPPLLKPPTAAEVTAARQPVMPPSYGLGYAKDPRTGRVTITSVAQKGLAAQMGLRPRDEIRTITRGKDVVAISSENDLRRVLDQPINEFRLDLARPNGPRMDPVRIEGRIQRTGSSYVFVPNSPKKVGLKP